MIDSDNQKNNYRYLNDENNFVQSDLSTQKVMNNKKIKFLNIIGMFVYISIFFGLVLITREILFSDDLKYNFQINSLIHYLDLIEIIIPLAFLTTAIIYLRKFKLFIAFTAFFIFVIFKPFFFGFFSYDAFIDYVGFGLIPYGPYMLFIITITSLFGLCFRYFITHVTKWFFKCLLFVAPIVIVTLISGISIVKGMNVQDYSDCYNKSKGRYTTACLLKVGQKNNDLDLCVKGSGYSAWYTLKSDVFSPCLMSVWSKRYSTSDSDQFCDNLSDQKAKDICIYLSNKEFKKNSNCQSISDEHLKDLCFYEYSTFVENSNSTDIVKTCSNIKDIELSIACYADVASRFHDTSICKQVPYFLGFESFAGTHIDQCMYKAGVITREVSFCNQIKDGEYQIRCYATLNKSGHLCIDEIKDDYSAYLCIREVAINNKDSNLCSVAPSNYKQECFTIVDIELNGSSDEVQPPASFLDK